MPLAKIWEAILGNFTGTGKKTQYAGTGHTYLQTDEKAKRRKFIAKSMKCNVASCHIEEYATWLVRLLPTPKCAWRVDGTVQLKNSISTLSKVIVTLLVFQLSFH